jgi:hypothetical protein
LKKEISKSTNILMGLSCGATLFLLAGIIVQSRNDDTINTPTPNLSFLPLAGGASEKCKKNCVKLTKNSQAGFGRFTPPNGRFGYGICT